MNERSDKKRLGGVRGARAPPSVQDEDPRFLQGGGHDAEAALGLLDREPRVLRPRFLRGSSTDSAALIRAARRPAVEARFPRSRGR